MATSASRKSPLVIARTEVVHKAPYLASMLYHFVMTETDKISTMAVTPNHLLLFNVVFINSITPKQLAGVLVHECMHVMSDHLRRMEVYDDRERANSAADLAIYQAIIDMGFELPDGGLRPVDFGFPLTLTLEEYYRLLEQKGEEGGGEGGKKPGVCSGMCGSGVGHGDPNQEADGLNEEGRSQGERDLAVISAVEGAKKYFSEHPGKEPGYFKELFKALEEPAVVNWRKALRYELHTAVGEVVRGSTDYTLKRLNKRTFLRNRPIPSMIDYPPTVSVIIDTSGSMHQELLRQCIRECLGILRGLRVEWIWLVQADYKVATPPIKAKLRDLRGEVKIHGRGGTDFTDALQTSAKLSPRPNITVYMTDGYGSTQFRPPGAVIWCLVGGNKERPADWGSVVIVDR